jgi:hypothetical protein
VLLSLETEWSSFSKRNRVAAGPNTSFWGQAHGGSQDREQGRFIANPAQRVPAPSCDDPGAPSYRIRNVLFHLARRRLVDQETLAHLPIESIADLELSYRPRQPLEGRCSLGHEPPATSDEPVNGSMRTTRLAGSSAPMATVSPRITLNTPGGKPPGPKARPTQGPLAASARRA